MSLEQEAVELRREIRLSDCSLDEVRELISCASPGIEREPDLYAKRCVMTSGGVVVFGRRDGVIRHNVLTVGDTFQTGRVSFVIETRSGVLSELHNKDATETWWAEQVQDRIRQYVLQYEQSIRNDPGVPEEVLATLQSLLDFLTGDFVALQAARGTFNLVDYPDADRAAYASARIANLSNGMTLTPHTSAGKTRCLCVAAVSSTLRIALSSTKSIISGNYRWEPVDEDTRAIERAFLDGCVAIDA